MKKQETVEVKYVKLNSTLILAFICLIVGFIGGNIYSVYKRGPSPQNSSFTMPDPSAAQMVEQKRNQILALENEAKRNPQNAATWLDLGNLYFDNNEPAKAITAYQEYLKSNPNNADVWTDLGVMYRQTGQSPKALDAFNKAISLDPRHQQSRFNKGIVLLYDMKDKDAAIKAWEELEKINPNFRGPDGRTVRDALASIR